MQNTLKNHKEKPLIAIDGGATKTEFLLFKESGQVIDRILLEGCNPNVCGIEKTFAILKSGIDALIGVKPETFGIFAGIAGYSSSDNSDKIDNFLVKAYPRLKISANSDLCNVIASATNLDKCVAVICGTGFSIFANVNGTLNRVGGWGYLLDCMGGGYDFGREALRAALAERDGFGRKTIITPLVEKKIGGHVWDNLNKVYLRENSFIASFAPIVFDAYEKNDEVAKEILNNNVERIAHLIKFAITTYDCTNNVVAAGSLFSKTHILLNLLKDRLDKNINIIVPELPQIYGACIRCCREFGNAGKDFFETFKSSYNIVKAGMGRKNLS